MFSAISQWVSIVTEIVSAQTIFSLWIGSKKVGWYTIFDIAH